VTFVDGSVSTKALARIPYRLRRLPYVRCRYVLSIIGKQSVNPQRSECSMVERRSS
jgi:hypothetical protein